MSEDFKKRLNGLAKEDLVYIVDRLMDGDDVNEVVKSLIPANINEAALSLHSILCNRDHQQGEYGCSFYTENSMGPEHKFWSNLVYFIMEKFSVSVELIYDVVPYLMSLEKLKLDVRTGIGEDGLKVFTYLLNGLSVQQTSTDPDMRSLEYNL